MMHRQRFRFSAALLSASIVIGISQLAAQTFIEEAVISPDCVPEVGTFWSLQLTNQPPLPFNPFPDLPVYAVDQDAFLIDDRSVDYDLLCKEMEAMQMLEAAALGVSVEELYGGGSPGSMEFTSEGLRLLVPEWQTNQVLLTLDGGEQDGV
jgi:hypothetical protein